MADRSLLHASFRYRPYSPYGKPVKPWEGRHREWCVFEIRKIFQRWQQRFSSKILLVVSIAFGSEGEEHLKNAVFELLSSPIWLGKDALAISSAMMLTATHHFSPTLRTMKTTYRLKPMAAARILAEFLSLIVCVLGPLICYPLGLFSSLPTMFRLAPLVVFGVAALLLPFYGFITFAVVRDDDGLKAISLLRKSRCAWQDIKSIKRHTTWNQTRYVLTTGDGAKINFPIWLSNCDQLVKEIRDYAPGSGETTSEGGTKMFRGSLSALVIQFFQSVLGLILAGIVWYFIFTTLFAKPVSQGDKLLVIGFALIVTGMFLWRALMVFLMPFVISSSPEELTLKSLFYRTAFAWDDVVSVALAPPLLPEGFILKTKRGDFLIAGSIEASDELKQELDGVIDSRPKKATA